MNPFHRRLRVSLSACALLIGATGAAQAQYAFDDAIMPPRAVAWRLGERGFSGISRPRFDGRAYVVEAFNPNGARVRLFVDARDGAILGRQRLDDGPVVIARPAPGYGWTEEDAMPRSPMRQAERLLPPGDIPMPESRGVPPRRPVPDAGFVRPEGGPDAYGRTPAEPNPHGINPDRRGPVEAPRRLARTGNPTRGPDGRTLDGKTLDGKNPEGRAQARTVPEVPKLRPVEAAKPEPKPEAPVATAEPPKAAAPAVIATPAAVQPPADGTVAKSPETKASETKASETKAAEAKPPAAKAAEQTWQNPPETKRNVRVIGGATLVPGAPDKDAQTP
ncbi:hypothetical protein [Methylobacterium sp. WL8]|uniref:hypothetical protein n=1 Tax=Methylobacterium sp. WL8 TaxID=2603899 RepID=UPI0011CB1177|nr:hypothetical protein [Methylobacterium sp. WL8]TXN84598.1 hypothetical protein FV234_01685 [Methylobacterium sp. WL8]